MKEESKDLRNKDRRESDLKGTRRPLSSEEIAEVTAEIRF